MPTPQEVAEILQRARQSLGERVHGAQLAFFGGSFTAIAPALRRALLQAAQPFVGSEGFFGIRISTRPDCISEEILDELVHFGVNTVELGVQSMHDSVLQRCGRGHTAQDVVHASRLIRRHGLQLGHQMMTGLPGDDANGALETAHRIMTLHPDMVRIYPTLVLKNTVLAQEWRGGAYTPQTLEEAVELGAQLLQLFEEAGIPVIRLGLHDEPELSEKMLAGPHHPSLRELCESRLLLQSVWSQLQLSAPGPIRLRVHPRTLSRMIGQHRCNLLSLQQMSYPATLIQDTLVPPMEVQVEVPEAHEF